ncbi:hypothetical protein OVA10_13535 [Lelliottia sp. SL45]|uniref:hypothetical protein n=1 Tax=Lelliottia sp. SL45 TaxID=2994665 RepID=UPI002273373D|nr:hypothetical protein [Lelliottia sp. SL45]MCY1699067.1 hypothetical protein [Lelliottia sp. SL45]
MAMMAGIGSAIGSVLGSVGSSLFGGGGSAPDPSGIISDASLKNSMSQPVPPVPSPSSMATGVSSTMQGSNPPPPGATPQPTLSGSQAPKDDLLSSTAKNMANGLLTSGSQEATNKIMHSLFHKNDAAKAGSDARKYLSNAFPELNPWERSGAGGTMSGIQEQQFSQQKQLTKMQLDNQKDIAQMEMDNQLKIAGIGSVTSRQNTADQVYAQNSMLMNNQRESNARIMSIIANTELSQSQKENAIANTLKSYAETHNINLSADQIKAQTNNILADTENLKGAKSWAGKVWSDFKNEGPSAPKSAFDIAFPYFDTSPIGTIYNKSADMFRKATGVHGPMSRK